MTEIVIDILLGVASGVLAILWVRSASRKKAVRNAMVVDCPLCFRTTTVGELEQYGDKCGRCNSLIKSSYGFGSG